MNAESLADLWSQTRREIVARGPLGGSAIIRGDRRITSRVGVSRASTVFEKLRASRPPISLYSCFIPSSSLGSPIFYFLENSIPHIPRPSNAQFSEVPLSRISHLTNFPPPKCPPFRFPAPKAPTRLRRAQNLRARHFPPAPIPRIPPRPRRESEATGQGARCPGRKNSPMGLTGPASVAGASVAAGMSRKRPEDRNSASIARPWRCAPWLGPR